jgi:hypothetical protein
VDENVAVVAKLISKQLATVQKQLRSREVRSA